jgi:hypothetical protein
MEDRMRQIVPRPMRLSDPGRDFSEEELKTILATPDKQMKFYEFNCLFQGRLPAGKYDEVIYFLSMALNYVLDEKDDWETLFPNLIIWLNDNEIQLRKEGLWNEILRKLNTQTNTNINAPFRLRRFMDKCHDSLFHPKGWNWFGAIDDTIKTCLTIYEETCPLLPEAEVLMRQRFETITSYDAAAWFIYLETNCPNFTILKTLAADANRKTKAIELIHDTVLVNELHLQFWNREMPWIL